MAVNIEFGQELVNKTVSSIKFHVSVAKYTSGKQGERCKTG